MKKNLVLAAVIVLVAIGGLLFVLTGKDEGKESVSTKPTSSVGKFQAVNACDVLTLAQAKQLLGENTVLDTNFNPPKTDDISTSTCRYHSATLKSTDSKMVEVVVRSALSSTGFESNKREFSNGKPAESQDVSGFGQEAFFIPETGSLNVLDGNYWYTFSSDEETLQSAEEIAHKVLGHHGMNMDDM